MEQFLEVDTHFTVKGNGKDKKTVIEYPYNNSHVKQGINSHTFISWNELIHIMAHLNNPIGDLCSEILRTGDIEDFDEAKIYRYLTRLSLKDSHLIEPVERLKSLYFTIYNSVDHESFYEAEYRIMQQEMEYEKEYGKED